MKGRNSGLAHGTLGSPQATLQQGEYANKVALNEMELATRLPDPLIDEGLIAELEQDGTKFTRDRMIFITRDKTGQIIWLEQGNAEAGLEHMIIRGHDKEFAKAFGSNFNSFERLLRDIIKYGKVLSCELKTINGKEGYEKRYDFGGRHVVLAAVGTNGFLVSAYPK